MKTLIIAFVLISSPALAQQDAPDGYVSGSYAGEAYQDDGYTAQSYAGQSYQEGDYASQSYSAYDNQDQ